MWAVKQQWNWIDSRDGSSLFPEDQVVRVFDKRWKAVLWDWWRKQFWEGISLMSWTTYIEEVS